MGNKLTPKQNGFVNDYIETKNATEAIVRNYEVKDRIVAKSMGSENLAKPCIQEAINPVVEEWINERNRLTQELKTRDLSDERYESIIKSLDILTKNIQLLSGGKTENIGIDTLSDEEKEKLLSLIK